MDVLDIPVDGGALRALRFGSGERVVVAAHGITASAMSFRAVARCLPAEWSLVSVDLRGRGGSAGLPGPFGMDRHAADLCAVAEYVGAPVVLTGQSMGAYAALRAAASRPELFTRLVLVDGGLPIPLPDGVDVDQVLVATVGPAITRLEMTFPSEDAYVEFFRAHPALGDHWTDDLTDYVRYDVAGEPGAIRSRVNAEAVRVDGADLLTGHDRIAADLAGLEMPATLLHAPRGMLGQEPGLLPQALVDTWTERTALRARVVPNTNHYTILMVDHGAKEIALELQG
ncbi:hypothetical protein GCM10023148_03530 [Actinokineospora soli]